MNAKSNHHEYSKIQIPGEQTTDGFIQETRMFKLLEVELERYKPIHQTEEELFKFALKALAIQLEEGANHGFYVPEEYTTFLVGPFASIDDHLIRAAIKGFAIGPQIKIDQTKQIVTNLRTKENLWFETIESIATKNLENALSIQMEKIKMVVQIPPIKGQIIKLLAGNEKEEYISDATKIFEDITQL